MTMSPCNILWSILIIANYALVHEASAAGSIKWDTRTKKFLAANPCGRGWWQIPGIAKQRYCMPLLFKRMLKALVDSGLDLEIMSGLDNRGPHGALMNDSVNVRTLDGDKYNMFRAVDITVVNNVDFSKIYNHQGSAQKMAAEIASMMKALPSGEYYMGLPRGPAAPCDKASSGRDSIDCGPSWDRTLVKPHPGGPWQQMRSDCGNAKRLFAGDCNAAINENRCPCALSQKTDVFLPTVISGVNKNEGAVTDWQKIIKNKEARATLEAAVTASNQGGVDIHAGPDAYWGKGPHVHISAGDKFGRSNGKDLQCDDDSEDVPGAETKCPKKKQSLQPDKGPASASPSPSTSFPPTSPCPSDGGALPALGNCIKGGIDTLNDKIQQIG